MIQQKHTLIRLKTKTVFTSKTDTKKSNQMKRQFFKSLLLLTVLMMLQSSSFCQSLTVKNLSTKKQTRFYLEQNLHCRDVVDAKIEEIDTLKARQRQIKEQLQISKSATTMSLRVVKMLVDSNQIKSDQIKQLQSYCDKQKRRKTVWRRCFLFASAVAVFEASILYSTW